MNITNLIEELDMAGYKPNHGFPDDYYVKEYTTEEGIKQYVIITIHVNIFDPCEFKIAHAGADWIEPVDFFCSPNHNKFILADTIWEADKILLKNEG